MAGPEATIRNSDITVRKPTLGSSPAMDCRHIEYSLPRAARILPLTAMLSRSTLALAAPTTARRTVLSATVQARRATGTDDRSNTVNGATVARPARTPDDITEQSALRITRERAYPTGVGLGTDASRHWGSRPSVRA